MKDLVTIGLPSKGRLKDKAISFFDKKGFKILQSKKERNYFGNIENKPNIKIIHAPGNSLAQHHTINYTQNLFRVIYERFCISSC